MFLDKQSTRYKILFKKAYFQCLVIGVCSAEVEFHMVAQAGPHYIAEDDLALFSNHSVSTSGMLGCPGFFSFYFLTGPHCVAQASIEFMPILTQSPKG